MLLVLGAVLLCAGIMIFAFWSDVIAVRAGCALMVSGFIILLLVFLGVIIV